MDDDLAHAAAVLAAAMVSHHPTTSPEAAAARYFDCLAALYAERKNRTATGAMKESKAPQTPGPDRQSDAYSPHRWRENQ